MISNILLLRTGPFTIVDVNAISDEEERLRVRRGGRRLLLDLIQKTRGTRLCRPDEFIMRRSDAWKKLARRNPKADWEEFVATFDPGFDDSDCDHRLDQKAFVIYQDPGEWNFLGVLYLYNVEIIGTTPTEIEVTAYPAPGLPFVSDVAWSNLVRRFLKLALESDFPLEDGKVLRVVSWKFPTREDHAWSGEPWAERLVSALEADEFEKEVVRGKLRKFSRPGRG